MNIVRKYIEINILHSNHYVILKDIQSIFETAVTLSG